MSQGGDGIHHLSRGMTVAENLSMGVNQGNYYVLGGYGKFFLHRGVFLFTGIAHSVANVGESGDRDRCLGTSVSYLGVNIYAPLATLQIPEKHVSLSFEVPDHHHSISYGTKILTQLD